MRYLVILLITVVFNVASYAQPCSCNYDIDPYIIQLANSGDRFTQYEFGSSYYDSTDFDKAFYWNEMAAKQGLSDHQCSLGYIYYSLHSQFTYEDISEDYATALYWLKKSDMQGNIWSQNTLGDIYNNTNGVNKDTITGCAWMHLANYGSSSTDYCDNILYESKKEDSLNIAKNLKKIKIEVDKILYNLNQETELSFE